MPLKKTLKNTGRKKRMINSIPTIKAEGGVGSNSSKVGEEAIVRQFHRIQQGYSKLMNDVAKELELVKKWIGSQATIKQKNLKARLSSRLSLH
jgi:hypothetical protein